MEKEFIVLYTGQKLKKAKTWHDGILKHDGRGTKAMLYDEKGGRLDSIHIKVQDITLGEQLESDRYYILVETLKTSTDKNSQDLHVTASQPAVSAERSSASQKGAYSQARCAGLKRKKTGFMPPRLVKQPRNEEQDSQDRSPQLLQDRIYSTQQTEPLPMGQSTDSFGRMSCVVPQNVMAINSGHNTVEENVLNIYSNNNRINRERCFEPRAPSNNRSSETGCEISSQSSNSSTSSSPGFSLSPWSVYGGTKTQIDGNSSVLNRKQYEPTKEYFGFKEQGNKSPYKTLDRNDATEQGLVAVDQRQENVQKDMSTSKVLGDLTAESNKFGLNKAITLEHNKAITVDHGSVKECEPTEPIKSRSMQDIMKLLRKNKQTKSNQESVVAKSDTIDSICCIEPPIENNVGTTAVTKSVIKFDRSGFESLYEDGSCSLYANVDQVQKEGTDNILIDNYDSLEQQKHTNLNSLPNEITDDNLTPLTLVKENNDTLFAYHSTEKKHAVEHRNESQRRRENDKENIESCHFESHYEDLEIELSSKAQNVNLLQKDQSKVASDFTETVANRPDDQKANTTVMCNPEKVSAEDLTQSCNEAKYTPTNILNNVRLKTDDNDSLIKDTHRIVIDQSNIETMEKEESNVSFSISFSPLSHDSLSDSENILQDKTAEGHASNDTQIKDQTLIVNSKDMACENKVDLLVSEIAGTHAMNNHSDNQLYKDHSQLETDSTECVKKSNHRDVLEQHISNYQSDYETIKELSEDMTENKMDVNKLKLKAQNPIVDAMSENSTIVINNKSNRVKHQMNCGNSETDFELETDEKLACLSTESQDTMEFSCDTLGDDSQNVLSVPFETIDYDRYPDKSVQANKLVGCDKKAIFKNSILEGSVGETNLDVTYSTEAKRNHVGDIQENIPQTLREDSFEDRYCRTSDHKGMYHLKGQAVKGKFSGLKDTSFGHNQIVEIRRRANNDFINSLHEDEVNEACQFVGKTHVAEKGFVQDLHEDKMLEERRFTDKRYISDKDCDNGLPDDSAYFKTAGVQDPSFITSSSKMSRIFTASQNQSPQATRPGLQGYMMRGVKYATVSREPIVPNQCHDLYNGSPNTHHETESNTIMSISPQGDSVVPECDYDDENHDDADVADDEDVYRQLYKPRPMYDQVKVKDDINSKGQGQTTVRSSLQLYRSKMAESKRLQSQPISNVSDGLNDDSYVIDKHYGSVPISADTEGFGNQYNNPAYRMQQYKNMSPIKAFYFDKHKNTPLSESMSFVSDVSIDDVDNSFTRTDVRRDFCMQKLDSQSDMDLEKMASREEIQVQDQHPKNELDSVKNMSDENMSSVLTSESTYNDRSKWDQYVPDQSEEEIDLNRYKRKEALKKDFSVIETVRNMVPHMENSNQKPRSSAPKHPFKNTICKDTPNSSDNTQRSFIQNFSSNKTVKSYTLNHSPVNIEDNIASCDIATVCDTTESLCSVDSLELLMAVENTEKDILPDESFNIGSDKLASDKVTRENVKSGDIKKREVGDESVTSGYVTCDNTVCDTDGSDKNSDEKNCNSVSNSILNNSSHNDGISLIDSLDLSLSFDDPADHLTTDKCPSFLQQPALRVSWKPQLQNNSNIERKTVLEKNNKANVTSRCLDILARSKLSPTVENKPPSEVSNKELSVSGVDTNRNVEIDRMSISQHQLDHVTNRSQSTLTLKHQLQYVDITESNPVDERQRSVKNSPSIKSTGAHYKSPVIYPQGNNHVKSPFPISRPQISNRFRPPSMIKTQGHGEPRVSPTRLNTASCLSVKQHAGLKLSCTELCFPGCDTVEYSQAVSRQVVIPESFTSVNHYKQILTSAILENLNSMLFEISKRYHQAMSRVDTSGYTKSAIKASSGPSVMCKCKMAAKILSVRKEGPNQGRQFYGCSKNSQQRCQFFQWADGKVSQFNSGTGSKRKICDGTSLGFYMKDQHVHFYPECQLIRKTKENIHHYFKRPKWARGRHEEDTVQKKQLFLKLPRKGHSSLYAKDDIWIISKDLHFQPSTTFLARSTFYGPLASNEVEIDPLYGYSPSNWSGEVTCHGVLAGNASTELNCLENIREHLTAQSPQVLPHLLNRDRQSVKGHGTSGFSVPRMVSLSSFTDHDGLLRRDLMDDMVGRYIDEYKLNTDQTEALRRVSHMFCQEKANAVDNVLLLHGVFGAGKSFLLSVMVLFLVEVFKIITSYSANNSNQVVWKLLISSTTNVAVDRILQGVLELGFEDFVRVGSVKKIAKPILPYSIHASGTDNQELKDLQEMLRSSDLTPAEKSHVRQSIEKHRQGENKKKLGAVKVVGVTCASCSVASLNNMQFPVVFLDECSQMTEPASLLPVARFGCQKLLLVGDPKQLDPTIEGAKAAHDQGLEQTMFDRLIKMGYIPTILRTQYRCHPSISAISNQLFYGDLLINGVTEVDRGPILDVIPTICFYDVDRGQECCEGGGSVYNEQEAQFVVFLLQVLTSSGIESQSIGVITLYRSQMSRIMDLIVTSGDDSSLKGIQVSTVDAFQGGERDVIILSCVRTKTCGFIDNDKRTNVALTRAKHHLLIVGHYRNLSTNIIWGRVLDHCRGHKDGFQSANESRQQLELYLERLSSQTSSESTESNKPRQKSRKSKTKGGKNSQSKITKTVVTSPSLNVGEKQSQASSVDDLPVPIDVLTCQMDTDMGDQRREVAVDLLDDDMNGGDGEFSKRRQHGETLGIDTSLDRGTLGKPSPIQRNTKLKYADRLQTNWFEEEPVEESVHESDEDLPRFQL